MRALLTASVAVDFRAGIFLCFLLVSSASQAAAPGLRGNLGIHDPSTIVQCKDRYYMFGTGNGIISKSSTDKVFWSAGPTVFAAAPAWTTNTVPGFNGTFWAPDIFYLNGRYCLYYAVSTWGSQVSAIGLVTNPTLDPADPAYRWTDQGIVIQSWAGSAYNTIDPSVMLDEAGNPWMAFGSYWSGIYVMPLDPNTGLRLPGSPSYRVAYNNSIEASCLYRRGAYYYLFVNWGSCCVGVNSTYNIRVGRSTAVTGPYRDRNGIDMAANGGTLFLEGTGKFTGPGHLAMLSEAGPEWFSYHYYDANAWAPWYGAYGQADFDLQRMFWTADGWPVFTNDWSAVYNFQADASDANGQYTGLLVNGAATTHDLVHGRVLVLNGTNQYVQLPPGIAYARTFSAVVNWAGGAAWQRIFDFGTGTSAYVMLTPSSGDGRLRCDLRANNSTQVLQWSNPLPVGVWTHVALTFDGSRGVLYVNGAAVATNTGMYLSPLDVRAQTNHLGRSKFTADPGFKGQIAQFKAHGRVLSAAEITAPQPNIAAPVTGSLCRPASEVAFHGSATDFADVPLSASSLSWRVDYVAGGVTNLVRGPLIGVTNGTFTVPADVAVSNSIYRITLVATDGSNRKATNTVEVLPVPATVPNGDWASFYSFTTGAIDASNRNHGTLWNGAAVGTDPHRGKVLDLPGAYEYVSLPIGAGAPQTVAAWVKWNGGAAWQRILDFGRDANRWFMLTPRDGDGRMQCGITTDRAQYLQVIQTAAAFPTGIWTHVALAFDGRQGIVYTNGRVAAVNNSVNLLPSDVAASRCYLGRSQFPADAYFDGQIDSLKLNSRSLASEELFAPTPVITQPAAGATFGGGQILAFEGSATDYADAPLSAGNFSWLAEFHHDTQIDRVFGPTLSVTNGAFQVPFTGPASTNVFYRLYLTVKDAEDRVAAVSRDMYPKISWLTLDTVPAGLEVSFDGQAFTTPVTLATVVGFTRPLSAPTPQMMADTSYDFVLWSDGGAQSHTITVPLNDTNFVASFVAPALAWSTVGTNLMLAWPSWAAPLALYSTTNLADSLSWTPVTNASVQSNQFRVVRLDAHDPARFFRLQSPP